MYEYSARIARVVDGDTFDADIDLGFKVHLMAAIRIEGVDTQELDDDDPVKAELGRRAKQLMHVIVENGLGNVMLRTRKLDKPVMTFARYVAEVWLYAPGVAGKGMVTVRVADVMKFAGFDKYDRPDSVSEAVRMDIAGSMIGELVKKSLG